MITLQFMLLFPLIKKIKLLKKGRSSVNNKE